MRRRGLSSVTGEHGRLAETSATSAMTSRSCCRIQQRQEVVVGCAHHSVSGDVSEPAARRVSHGALPISSRRSSRQSVERGNLASITDNLDGG